MDTLSGYILLPKNAPKQGDSPSDTIAAVLPQLKSVFQDAPGEYWAAAGIQFTSFEMIDAFGLITVSFGVDLQVGLLGSCAMTFPKGDPYPVAYVEVDLIASVTPATGLFSVMGKLSPASNIYGGFVHLSGGFAFDVWFDGEHKGDFVVSLGGYSPFLQTIAPYPAVPRLGLSYGLGPFQVTGQAYFALTPAMMMAGMSMSAVWSSGPIKAWINAGIDMLFSWAPLHYEAEAYAVIGCAIDLWLFTIQVQVGADLLVWRPPFGGTAHVNLDVVSFDICFGAPRTAPGPIGWASFKQNFLPKDSGSTSSAPRPARSFAMAAVTAQTLPKTNIISASVISGLKQSKLAVWVVDPDDFIILTNSTIPANHGEWQLSATQAACISPDFSSYNSTTVDVSKGPDLRLPSTTKKFSATQVWNPTLNIEPMHLNNVQSYHTIAVIDTDTKDYVTSLSVEPVLQGSNTALWGPHCEQKQKNANDAKFLEATLIGFRLTPIPRHPAQTSSVDLINLLFESGRQTGFSYQARAVDTTYTVEAQLSTGPQPTLTITVRGGQQPPPPIDNYSYVLKALADSWVSTRRRAILTDLALGGFATLAPTDVDVSDMATSKALIDWPKVELLAA